MQFWKMWEANYPGTLSQKNLMDVSKGISPTVDQQWLVHFPEHHSFLGEIIEQHHIDYGSQIYPLPYSLHKKAPGNKIWHMREDKNND